MWGLPSGYRALGQARVVKGGKRIHELIAETGFYVQMAGGANFFNQAQAVHSKGIISALGLFLGGYLLRLRGR